MDGHTADTGTDVRADAAQQAAILTKKNIEGSGWFFWIAGLSLVNSVILLSGSEWGFLIGLGITQIVDAIVLAIAEEAGGAGVLKVFAFLFDLFVAASFVLWGVLARKGQRWAYVVGMILYALDGLIFLLFMDLPSLGFHVFALFFIFAGYKASGQLQKLSNLLSAAEAAGPAAPPAVPPVAPA